ncbi:MAG: hypothetical protein AAFQ67_08365 [Pseudomonadota bacterium]
MRLTPFVGLVLLAVIGAPSCAQGDVQTQSAETVVRPAPAPNQDYCLGLMSGFPNSGHVARYQFFRLVQDLAVDADAPTRAALEAYGDGEVDAGTPVAAVIEDIANPVLRQALPQRTVAQTAHLIDFAVICAPYIDGQISSLTAFDASLADADFNRVIAEDALFLRQVMADALYRLGAGGDPDYAIALAGYAASLTAQRDQIEFAAFDAEVDELEALFLGDLDRRLALSNEAVNSEMDGEATASAVSLAQDMSEAARAERERQMLQTLGSILIGG